MEDMYVQCKLKCEDVTTVAWIEQKYAKVGLSGKFKDVPDDDRRWEVVEASGDPLPKSAIASAHTFISHAHPANKMRGNK